MADKQTALAQTQRAFANAIRRKDCTLLQGVEPHRLRIYAQLVRNSTLGFIQRCFTETSKHCDPEQWQQLQEDFIQTGQAHSPYFQEIALEFLHFCQQQQRVSADILALMDFEYSQLLAEVAFAEIPTHFSWDADTLMQLSPVTYLKHYDVSFLKNQFEQIISQPSYLIIWRNRKFDVYYQEISELDFYLLSCLQEQPLSLNQLTEELTQLLSVEQISIPLIQNIWQKWINAQVIFPSQIKQQAE